MQQGPTSRKQPSCELRGPVPLQLCPHGQQGSACVCAQHVAPHPLTPLHLPARTVKPPARYGCSLSHITRPSLRLHAVCRGSLSSKHPSLLNQKKKMQLNWGMTFGIFLFGFLFLLFFFFPLKLNQAQAAELLQPTINAFINSLGARGREREWSRALK